MIRREDLGRCGTDIGLVTRVKRGETVRVVGLGTLARVEIDTTGPAPWNFPGPRKDVYRLTLTAAVAKGIDKTSGKRVVDALEKGSEAFRLLREHRIGVIAADVRHLARALGADVEVWAAGAMVTKVSP